jgi:hypothetical protein
MGDLGGDIVTGWMLICCGMAMMSERVFLFPPLLLFFSLGRRRLKRAALVGILGGILGTDCETSVLSRVDRVRYVTNVLFHAAMVLCVALFWIKEAFID